MIIFVTGGARSGKSDFAQDMAEKLKGKRLFLATAQAFDEEMRHRIQEHREDRGDRWDTVEEPIYLGRALRAAAGSYNTILVDCLTLWMSNIIIPPLEKKGFSDEKISEIMDDFFLNINKFDGTIIIVSNEVGMGIVPDNKLARLYRDQLGFLNQKMAGAADEVYALLSGIHVRIK
ncbi:MAG: bifunctional adenosylcobinamide kinase/adenosylcobinamide-phosphate guanylyltransferase [Desulfobacterales bacterium]|uniref:Adenosylcobinamide kinase n=1 Tax=Candidatus Desulfaltia bathyphila TaxID=2841697 RepID=A0A8J6N7I1_9BACT|nr:bifunctional adenosylcobinamide kinase/adenosylcobinamide-phosphate guanylyltransferase [Candidatus Desulfaltia bathyphila]MBL7195261.1 bifunctional adenosylcobinamide kinase/adenosylcobinamide-phosphate guanylyltransferase [Desulfobacterales bacterium]MBL7207302.1 bifunctional adenosylcobinamide kinase/adenosylcobinamide-phosphate guanylyltransferase [Desulfobacterales bacterium]